VDSEIGNLHTSASHTAKKNRTHQQAFNHQDFDIWFLAPNPNLVQTSETSQKPFFFHGIAQDFYYHKI
jgi:hypothetical protein